MSGDTALEIAAAVRSGERSARERGRGAPRPHRRARGRAPRVQPRHRRAGARGGRRRRPPGGGGRGPGPAGRGAGRAEGQPVHRRACPPRARRRSSRAGARPTTPPWSPACATPGPSPSARRTSTSSRWARPPRTRRSGPPATRTTPRRVPGGSSGGSAAAVAAGFAPICARVRHRRVDPPAGGALRRRRREADLRPGVALRPRRVRVEPRPDRPVRRHGGRRRRGARGHRRPRPRRLHLDPRGQPPSLLDQLDRGVEGLRVGIVQELLDAEGIAPDVAARAQAAAEALERGGRQGRGGVGAGRDLRPVRLLPDRPGRGVEQPRPLRRRPLRPAGRRAPPPARCTTAPAPPGSAPR